MPKMYAKRNNGIVQRGDIAMFFTDGKGLEGSNQSGALVIAPETKDALVGGLRMDAMGNLEVRGDIEVRGNVKAVQFDLVPKWWPDFVFDKSYKLKSLFEIETFIKNNGHLPNIPSTEEVKNNGISLGEMQAKQLQKIEELTLYTIEQEKKLNAQKEELKKQKQALTDLEEKLNLLLSK